MGPDTTATAALGARLIRPRFLAWIDIIGDPLYATTWPADLTPSGLGDAEIDGHTFFALEPGLVDVSPVVAKRGGTNTVTATLSGIAGVDDDLLDLIDDPANWRFRVARLWQGIADAAWAPQGAIWPYYTGWITNLSHGGGADGARLTVTIESYLGLLVPPTYRTYLDQARHDPGDLSAEVVLNAANHAANNGMTPGLVGNGASRDPFINAFARIVLK